MRQVELDHPASTIVVSSLLQPIELMTRLSVVDQLTKLELKQREKDERERERSKLSKSASRTPGRSSKSPRAGSEPGAGAMRVEPGGGDGGDGGDCGGSGGSGGQADGEDKGGGARVINSGRGECCAACLHGRPAVKRAQVPFVSRCD